MADVKPPSRDRTHEQRRDGDRGQLFLVGAITIAVLFLALGMMLNTAIYTENLATRGDGSATTDVVDYRSAAVDHAKVALSTANYEHNTSYANLRDRYRRSIQFWENTTAVHRAGKSHVASLTETQITNGTRLEQDDASRNLTSDDGESAWTLATDARVRNYSVNVSEDSLLAVNLENVTEKRVYHVSFTDAAGTWSVYVYASDVSSTTVAVFEDGSKKGTCSRSEAQITIGLTNASMEGTRCQPLADMWAGLGRPYDISYSGGANATGTYTMVVNGTDTVVSENFDGAGSPYQTPALYSARLDIVYRTPALYYTDDFRVAPGEPDA